MFRQMNRAIATNSVRPVIDRMASFGQSREAPQDEGRKLITGGKFGTTSVQLRARFQEKEPASDAQQSI